MKMSNQEITNKIKTKLEAQSVEMLKDIIIKLNDDLREKADLILPIALNVLIEKIPEKDFVSFCDTL